ncbi:DUF2935 domain-containing protein [Paenibacillus crassostreae]|uniref:DUF2935 domain-containing protein n=1 Tax=Paenibacillus crassostreae TaxID=1763538 RepID=A0A167DRA4_9BACL|nr:DUF2935 domain-containing protein [Paenibacillus crassostreae]AOZ91152.1 hypothetical protein LPB68_02300 [Paenibacillus crassostreae]OAB74688.1 hypothetical protein PNBC_11660 [Paenibacillus crassostreae]
MDQEAIFEHQFWLQILGDHARFINNALPPVEKKDIEIAQQFIQIFDQLLEQSRRPLDMPQFMELNKLAHQNALSLRAFKLDLLERLLLGKVMIGLTPTFINHMVNELEEYIRILDELIQGKPVPKYHSLHHDLLWLQDASGHAATIAMDLDAVEKRWIEKSEDFEQHFNQFLLKAIELTGYLRTLNNQYPSIIKFHEDVNLEMVVFMNFLQEVEEMGLTNTLLSRINPLVPDHMFREECYYLMKLSQSGQITPPNCNPAKPRVKIP